MHTISIDLVVPIGWHELSDKQLRYLYYLIANECSADEIKTLCLLRWSRTRVIGRQTNGAFLLQKGNSVFDVMPITIAELLPNIDWITTLPSFPVRLQRIKRHKALPADFSEVPLETFIICDNLYQGYLATKHDNLLDELGGVLYGKKMNFNAAERICFFYWFAALKAFLARKYSDFFQPMAEDAAGNMLAEQQPSVEEAMNAQIRALTKGDVTKEKEVLAIDTHRALTELNAQAREYKQFNAQYNKK